MLLATIVLLCPPALCGATAKVITGASSKQVLAIRAVPGLFCNSDDFSLPATAKSASVSVLPLAPVPKVNADAKAGDDVLAGRTTAGPEGFVAEAGIVSRDAIEPHPTAPSIAAVNQVVAHRREQRRLWYVLSFAGSGAAAFDAWSTRRAITLGYGVEANPTLRPFANSGALYGATQVSPLVMDFIGKRMMRSRYSLMRKIWWLPQAAGSSVSTAVAVHSVRLVP
jgi:hypothetical protein